MTFDAKGWVEKHIYPMIEKELGGDPFYVGDATNFCADLYCGQVPWDPSSFIKTMEYLEQDAKFNELAGQMQERWQMDITPGDWREHI